MYIGVDLGGTNIAVGLVDESGRIISTASLPTQKERDYTAIVADMALLAKKVAADGGVSLNDVKGVGIGCPGTVDNSSGTVVYANNIRMDHAPIAQEFRRHIDLPVNLENDANAAALGEYICYGEGAECFVFITLGTGVGGGVILDGKIFRGFNGAGAELGHATLIHNGKPCTCGKRGCWETYASVTALIEQTREAMEAHPESMMIQWAKEHGKINGRTAFECAKLGDRIATDVRDQYIEYVAEGICSIVNIIQPNILAIGGGISREGAVILDPVREYVGKYDYNKHMPKTDIRIARLFGDAGIVGAAMSAKQ